MNAHTSEVRRIVENSRSSFYWGMRLLPPAQRDAMFAIYAYCRELDDIADGPLPVQEKLARLEIWRREIDTLYCGNPVHTLTEALAEPVRRFRLDREEFEALIDGMEMDVRGTMIAPDWPVLKLYCRNVAGAVGMLAVKVFGCNSPQDRAFAVALGEALQLTNILRDLAEDAELGRLYLSRDVLDAAGITAGAPALVLSDPNLAQACDALARRAEDRFAEAQDCLGDGNSAKAMRPALLMMDVYHRLLGQLKERGWTDLAPPPKPSKMVLLWIAARCFLAPAARR